MFNWNMNCIRRTWARISHPHNTHTSLCAMCMVSNGARMSRLSRVLFARSRLRYSFHNLYSNFLVDENKKWVTYLRTPVKHHNNRSFYWKFIATRRRMYFVGFVGVVADANRILLCTRIRSILDFSFTECELWPLIAAHYAKYCQSEVVP